MLVIALSYLVLTSLNWSSIFQVGKGRTQSTKHVRMTVSGLRHTGIDLLICDVPENRPVPSLSPDDVPVWNLRSEDMISVMFSFAEANLQDNGVVLVIHAKDRVLDDDLEMFADLCHFVLVREWVGGNLLKLSSTHPRQPTVFISSPSKSTDLSIMSSSIHKLIFVVCYLVDFNVRH